ncbi:MAG: hypothetical protein RLZ22_270 [Verrucomicrobiota bacterium]|jgi:hypothetical protein
MNNEQINIAIAEACGMHGAWELKITPCGCDGQWDYFNPQGNRLPDYCDDLNAMHEAEKIFDQALYCRYINELCDITIKGNNSMYMASAVQRAEAFLKTINKWEGGRDE